MRIFWKCSFRRKSSDCKEHWKLLGMQRTKIDLPNGHHVLYIRYFHRAKHIVFPRKKLTLKAPPIICRRQHFQILPLFQNFQNGMIFHENRLLADDSPEISYLIYFQKLGKMSQNLSSASVVIGSLRVITLCLLVCLIYSKLHPSQHFFSHVRAEPVSIEFMKNSFGNVSMSSLSPQLVPISVRFTRDRDIANTTWRCSDWIAV